MADIVSPRKRSEMMSGIRAKDTKPELVIRRVLHRLGFRFRLHRKDLPGRPDLVLNKYKAVIFIHGCFWHQHNCRLFKMPSSRQDFWEAKLSGNVKRDEETVRKLKHLGWRIGIVWECAIKNKTQNSIGGVAKSCAEWLLSNQQELEIIDA